jgi:hypothetical protein
MKKLNLLLGLGILSLIGLFTSCSKNEDALGPSLEIISGETDTVPANSILTINWRANAGDANLKSFTIKEGNAAIVDEDGKDWTAFDIPSANNEAYVGSARVKIGAAATTFTLMATDKDGLTVSKTVNMVISVVAVPLVDKGSSQLGAGASALPSYYSVVDDKTLSLAEAKASPNKVDFVFTSTASAATIKSAKDAAAAEISGTNRVTNYQKATIDFSTATAKDLEAVNPTADNITVSLNDVIVFKTQDNIKGIFKVDQLTVKTDGTVTISIKIKQ